MRRSSSGSRPRAVAGVVIAFVAVGAAACGGSGHAIAKATTISVRPAQCLTGTPSATAGTPIEAVLVGPDPAKSSSAVESTWNDAFSAVLAEGFATSADVVVASAGRNGVSIDLEARALGSGPNATWAQASAACVSRAMTADFASAVSSLNGSSLDLLADIGSLMADLHGLGEGRGDLVVLSSDVQTAAPLDLANPSVLGGDPTLIASELARTGNLPDLAGWDVYFPTAGEGTAQRLGDPGQQELAALWWRVVHAAGGSTHLIAGTLTAFPAPAMPAPPVPRPIPIDVNPSGASIFLPDQMLFAFDSAVLEPGAVPELDPVLGALLVELRASVTIAGYADATGGQGPFNIRLSAARAEAVASFLIAHGIAPNRIHVVSYGASHFADPANPTAAVNRRVVIRISEPGGAS
jgi:outer membrane protein OmpA-like peptidoglycan-associated protein